MLTIALVLALADAPRSAVRAPKPAPAAPQKRRPVVITKIEPLDIAVNRKVTVTGSGFDQGSVVLIGEFAPVITERSDTRLVFLAPYDPEHPEAYQAPVHLVTPGNLVAAVAEITVSRFGPSKAVAGARPTPAAEVPGGPSILVSEKVSLSAAAPKSFRVDMEGANSLAVSVDCTGGDVSMTLRPEGKTEPSVSQETWMGSLHRKFPQKVLRDPDAPPLGPVLAEFTTSSAQPLDCTMTIGRSALQEKKGP